jgi:hypothetical protein
VVHKYCELFKRSKKKGLIYRLCKFLEAVLVDECNMSADHGWNVTNVGSRIIRAECVAVLGQT